MAVCSFFGHRECPKTIQPILESTLESLITERGVDVFYMGNQGQFDTLVRHTLQELTKKHPHIRCTVVLAYMPGKTSEFENALPTLLPEGIENAPPRYAISWRNRWMLDQSDYVVTYITHSWGGAYPFAQKAKRQGKHVINIT